MICCLPLSPLGLKVPIVHSPSWGLGGPGLVASPEWTKLNSAKTIFHLMILRVLMVRFALMTSFWGRLAWHEFQTSSNLSEGKCPDVPGNELDKQGSGHFVWSHWLITWLGPGWNDKKREISERWLHNGEYFTRIAQATHTKLRNWPICIETEQDKTVYITIAHIHSRWMLPKMSLQWWSRDNMTHGSKGVWLFTGFLHRNDCSICPCCTKPLLLTFDNQVALSPFHEFGQQRSLGHVPPSLPGSQATSGSWPTNSHSPSSRGLLARRLRICCICASNIWCKLCWWLSNCPANC